METIDESEFSNLSHLIGIFSKAVEDMLGNYVGDWWSSTGDTASSTSPRSMGYYAPTQEKHQ